jgi:hypothetical protein
MNTGATMDSFAGHITGNAILPGQLHPLSPQRSARAPQSSEVSRIGPGDLQWFALG